ncbi:hypothetical protein N7494_012619 [Penicillium frequentans]|uniref:Uncharacterized protein n=1 Tax=Penicillium frequentans TaxID=3151616 RepID=A0AAD6CM06_9EURO|nr:hypothetical protein N7494_012619 [Penicillium glabrum]
MWPGSELERKSFQATRKELADSLLFYSQTLKGPQVLGKREKAQAAQQYLFYDAKLLMGRLIKHANVIGITYRNICRCYVRKCELIIEEFDELIANLEKLDYFLWHAWKTLDMLSYLVSRLVLDWERDKDSTAASDMHNKVTQ